MCDATKPKYWIFFEEDLGKKKKVKIDKFNEDQIWDSLVYLLR